MALRIDDLTFPIHAASFTLPTELEAREPAEVRGKGRDDVRLLVTRGPRGDTTQARFDDLPGFLGQGDLVVLNSSATIPSSLPARTSGGEPFRLHISTRLGDGVCIVEARDHSPRPGEIAALDAEATVTFVARYRDSRRLWRARLAGTGDIIEYLHRWGKPISYKHVLQEWPIETYQTVYAFQAGSAEMPSAGRPFTRALLNRLDERGIRTSCIVLHTGVSSPERDEPPYEEQFRVPADTVDRIVRTRAQGGRVIAVGTTVVRALESATDEKGDVAPTMGWTDLLITPKRGLRVVDGMITGFHEPRSTHLALLETLAGRQHIENAYAAALEGRYLWHEFGDSHLLLP